MKNYKIILFLMLALLAQNFNAQEVKKPSDVFGFYFDTFVKYDQAGLVKLNEYLKPTVEGKNAYEINLKETADETLKAGVDSFLSTFHKNTANDCRKEAEDYFKIMTDNFKNGKLSITNVKMIENEYVKDQKIALINYSVSFKVPSKLSDMPITNPKRVKSEDLKKYLIQITEEFKNADKTVTTEQEFSLYQLSEGGKIYYWNGSPDEIVSKLTDFYFESFEPK